MAGVLNAVGHEFGRNAHILALLDAARATFCPDARQQRGARLLRHRLGRANTRGSDCDVGRALEPLADQRIELRVAKALPPAFGGPCALSAGECRVRFQRLGRRRNGLWPKVGNARAAREQAENSGGEKNCPGHGFQRY